MTKPSQPKFHIIFQKEDIIPDYIDQQKVAVVFDVLLATTTIATLLQHGASEVIPVMDGAEALRTMESLDAETAIIAGESAGFTIDGFLDPLPVTLKQLATGKKVVLSTTNGTVAIQKVANAKKVYAAALVNGCAVAEKIVREHSGDTLLVFCAGTMKKFSLEDFYGAGYFIHQVMQASDSWELTDAAKTALLFYEGNKENAVQILKESATGQMMLEMNAEEDIIFSAQQGIFTAVPELKDGKMILA